MPKITGWRLAGIQIKIERLKMVYDNTKLTQALHGWIKAKCDEGFGSSYARDLQDSFEAWCAATGALKRSPGHVAFGRELKKLGFTRYKVGGLSHYEGLLLKEASTVEAITDPKVKQEIATMVRKRAEVGEKKLEKIRRETKAQRKVRMREFKKEMKQETAKRNRSVDQAEASG
jgi:hypothetical protein